MQDEYTIREVIHLLKDQRVDISEIKSQVQQTNGRVDKLENWRWFITGGISILGLIVVPILIYLFTI